MVAVNVTCAGAENFRSSPASLPPSLKFKSGPFVANVCPCFREDNHGVMLRGPDGTFTKTRFNPTGPRRDAKLAMASVPAAAGSRKPQFRSEERRVGTE